MNSAAPQILSAQIEVRSRFMRSVQIEKDYGGSQRNGDYILTPNARRVINIVAEGLKGHAPSRALTITGPYGVGKSAFAVYLTRLLCGNGDSTAEARRQLHSSDRALAERLLSSSRLTSGKGFFPLLVTARRAPTSVCLLEGMARSIAPLKSRPVQSVATEMEQVLRRAKREGSLDSAEVVAALEKVNDAVLHAGYSGVLFFIDELGKLFEFAARTPQKADVYLLQQLAEFASRSAEKPVVLIGVLHQSFEDYGQHIDNVSRKEWEKIQGRYQNLTFLEPPEQVIRLIASAIRWKTKDQDDAFRKRLVSIARQAAQCSIVPQNISPDEFERLAVAAYPLHPTTLVALPYLFRRFAQNERSLFSFLSSLEQFGFQEFLQGNAICREKPAFIRLSQLFDYFIQNFGMGLFRQPHARRWMEAADALERKDNLQDVHVKLVKTIGILNALGEISPLDARKPVIQYALSDDSTFTPEAEAGVNFLKGQSILIYRKFNNTYRIWEGSDVDLDERISEGERQTRNSLSLATVLARYLEPRPLVARRHSYETGAIRLFSVVYIDNPSTLEQTLRGPAAEEGRVLVCLSVSGAQIEEYRRLAKSLQPGHDNLLITIPQEIGNIRAAAFELAALHWVWQHTSDLRDDRVARRELGLRIADAEQILKGNVQRLLDHRPEPVGSNCLWLFQGVEWAMSQSAGVSQLLSHVCDKLYKLCPCIKNELVVRRNLSSAAAAARRNLIEGMLARAHSPALGIEGFPPERSIYASVLLATGMHAQDKSGKWQLQAPPAGHSGKLAPAWQRLSELVFQPQPEPIALDRLFHDLTVPPWGVLDGVHPILLCAFMVVHAEEVTLYREGTFLPEPGIADFELLMRRPELFAIAGCRVEGARAAVISRLARGLGVRPATVPVVRALFKMVRSLPEFAWRSSRVPETVRRLRSAFDTAKSPERFLFVELPEALNVPRVGLEAAEGKTIELFFADLNHNLQILSQATPIAIENARDQLLESCGFPPGPENWQSLRETAIQLEPHTTNTNLLAFLRRLTQSQNDPTGVASVLALIANCPPASWSDFDLDRFPQLAQATATLFKEARAVLNHPQAAPEVALSASQQREANRIQQQLRHHLEAGLEHHDPVALRAALLALAAEIKSNK